MKMRKVILGCSALAVALFFASCNKDKTVAEPVQDTEFQSTKDVIYANTVAAELEQMVAYIAEGQTATKYMAIAPGSTGTITNNTSGNVITVVFSNSVTCADGKKRDGTIQITESSNPISYSASIMHDPGYVATVDLTNYWVDGWNIKTLTPFVVTNTSKGPLAAFNPASDKLTWTYTGKLSIENVADAGKNMVWEGNMTKTIVNTNNPKIFDPTKLQKIAWSSTVTANNANITYGGSSKGETKAGTAFTFSITEENPLVRDYACSPDKVLGVTNNTVIVYSEWHPFIGGIANFTTGTLEPRKVDFSNEGMMDCDNAVKVTIKGVDTPVDLMK